LAEAFHQFSAEARTIRTPDGDYGHLLMSRWPMSDSQCIDLTVKGREPRMAISSRVDSPGGAIRVLSTHLGLSPRERGRQLAIIVRHLEATRSEAAIVMGDFNEWRRRGPAMRALCPSFELAAGQATFPARRPLFALDRIWSRRPLSPVRSTVATEYRNLSDHLAVLAELRFAPSVRSR
jgi:endonuclease/exonuclease/phosphatase family metal-dependent hydrolase